ncbi:MAG: SWIM zinc finger family protein [Nitrospirae bacterium]|nr:SWIM zinc finger family protein [Nitrospirota bacterium]
MAGFGKTWWGKRFIEALETFTDDSRLARGRAYARNGRILSFLIENSVVTATVRGSINPYFGVRKEPRYVTTIEIERITTQRWSKVIGEISQKAGFVAKLLMNEMPDNIEDIFSRHSLALLPQSEEDIKAVCSCPDWANPCKHIAGVYYLLASALDNDPFLMFELRGLSRADLQGQLRQSPLGRVLSEGLNEKEIELEAVDSHYTQPKTEELKCTYSEFWGTGRRLPQLAEPVSRAVVPAILIKKQGDYPPFWHRDNSFIEAMELIYTQVRSKNRSSL